MTTQDVLSNREIRDPQGTALAYLVPLAEKDRDPLANLSAEVKSLRQEADALRAELSGAHRSIAELHARIEVLSRERCALEADRDEYLRALYFMSKEETKYTEADLRASLETALPFVKVIEQLHVSPER